MFKFFEDRLKPTEVAPESPPPKDGDRALMRFYWHYARQARGLVALLFATGLAVAMMDTLIPIFIGRVVTLVSTHRPDELITVQWPTLILMASALLIGRPAALLARALITNQAIAGNLTNLVRWQSHWHVVRQSWTFFQNDFAGRVANRVM